MFTIINNHRYDADTDTRLASWDNGLKPGDLTYEAEHLYRNRAGLYFLLRCGGPLGRHKDTWGSAAVWLGQLITPLTDAEATEWLAKHPQN